MTIEVEWVVLGYSLVCALLAGIMASTKSRNVGMWIVLGFFAGIVAILILSFLGNAGIRWVRRK